MDNYGVSPDFLLCKIGLAIAVIAIIGAITSINAGYRRFAERQELEQIAGEIAKTIDEIDKFLGDAELKRELSATSGQFEVLINGKLADGLQLIQIQVSSDIKTERLLELSTTVNRGDFFLSVKNPREILAKKSNGIEVELS